MSRLWRDQIQVYLAPRRMDMVRYARGLKPLQTGKMTVFSECTSNTPIEESALELLEHNLENTAGTDLSITLSNHFVRYVTLPPQSEISTPEEVQSYAAFRMREIYAERVDTWLLSISAWNPFSGAICAAISRRMMAKLEEMALRHQLKLKGIEPYLASVYDQWQTLLGDNKTYFAVIETGRICIAVLVNGSWYSIRNQKILHNTAEELLAGLDQEAILSGNKAAVEMIHLFAPEHPDLKLPENCGWSIVPIQTGQIPALAHYPTAPTINAETKECHA